MKVYICSVNDPESSHVCAVKKHKKDAERWKSMMDRLIRMQTVLWKLFRKRVITEKQFEDIRETIDGIGRVLGAFEVPMEYGSGFGGGSDTRIMQVEEK